MAPVSLIDLLRSTTPERQASARLHVALSGGLDSTVLLHALVRAGFRNLVAVHVHHGLQAAADDWVLHCESICREWGVPLRVCRVEVRPDGKGVEAAAREARYAALRSDLQSGELIVTAHHQDDQAETVLLNLMRGSGPAGLSAMAPLRGFGKGQLWRPLLGTPRETLRAYAEQHRLAWIEDPHNRDGRFARSFLRGEILPRLVQRWPELGDNLARAASLASESTQLLREFADADIANLSDPCDGSLPVTELLGLSAPRRRNIVRAWVLGQALPVPGHETLEHLDRDVLRAAQDAAPVLAWSGGEFRRHGGRLYAMSALPPVPDDFHAQWDGRSDLALPDGCGALQATPIGPAQGSAWTVRLARPADRFKPAGSPRTRTLKNLFQEGRVPTWVRERTPLIADAARPVWIGGFGWAADQTAGSVIIEWRHRPAGAPARS